MENLSKKRVILTSLIGGLFVGLINGFFGGGGGMLLVPLLTYFLKMPEKKAHATAIFVILPLSVVSSIVYITSGVVDWLKLLYSTIGFVLGGLAGALLLKKLNNNIIKIIFSLVMIGAGIKMLF